MQRESLYYRLNLGYVAIFILSLRRGPCDKYLSAIETTGGVGKTLW